MEQTLCSGCLSMYCRACVRAQGEALRQVEGLLARLEAAEALYPSSQAFAAHYPLYKSPEFTGRVKAMCLWYNMTKHHRLKLQILGKLLMMLHTKKKQDETSDSGIRYFIFLSFLFLFFFLFVLRKVIGTSSWVNGSFSFFFIALELRTRPTAAARNLDAP